MIRLDLLFILVAISALSLKPIRAGIERTDFSLELIESSDVSLLQINSVAVAPFGNWQSEISLSASEFSFDYAPVDFDFNGSKVSRDEKNHALQMNSRRDLNDRFTLLLGAGAYDGFTNYRSAWLDEYYDHQFSDLTGVPGAEFYRKADPKGFNANAGLRWMYRPSSAFAQLTLSRLQDDVAPGYEIDFDGLRRGQLVLATTAVNLSTENILTKRIRSLVSLRASQTSERSWRYGGEIALNAALGERWIARVQAGATTETQASMPPTEISPSNTRSTNDFLSIWIAGITLIREKSKMLSSSPTPLQEPSAVSSGWD